MKDTSTEINVRFQARLMALPPAEHLAMATGMFDAAQALVLAGLRAQGAQILSGWRKLLATEEPDGPPQDRGAAWNRAGPLPGGSLTEAWCETALDDSPRTAACRARGRRPGGP